LTDHVASQVARHEPTIINTAQRFNKIVDEMEALIRKRRAPRHAVIPKHLDRDALFSLDIDDPIWNDRGLDDEDSEVPRWLADDNVCNGISAMLMIYRCEEEECYLLREAVLLQAWYVNEWERLSHAIARSDGASHSFMSYPNAHILKGGLLHYLERKRDGLVHLGAHWCDMLDGTELADGLSSWGSAEQHFSQALSAPNVYLAAGQVIDSSDESEVFVEESSDILWEMEALQLEEESMGSYSVNSVDSDSDETNVAPPAKRKRPS
jgi:hypothetical protein